MWILSGRTECPSAPQFTDNRKDEEKEQQGPTNHTQEAAGGVGKERVGAAADARHECVVARALRDLRPEALEPEPNLLERAHGVAEDLHAAKDLVDLFWG